jgi:hypothetical protein
MYTRKEYIDGNVSHREYFAQFVDDTVKNEVILHFGKTILKESTDEHLNDIPLKKWDDLTGFRFNGSTMVSRPSSIRKELLDKLKETGEGVSPAGLVCIYKEAAKQIKEKL